MNRQPLLRLFMISAAFGAVAIPAGAADVEFKKGVVFAKRDGRELKLDVMFDSKARMQPAVMFIHGGYLRDHDRRVWHGGTRDVAERGYVAATIDYRAEAYPAKRMIDVGDAFRFLTEHASDYGVDPERVGVVGVSGGSHLALMVALAEKQPSKAHRFRAVVNLSGPTDLWNGEASGQVRRLVELVPDLNPGKRRDDLKQISPVAHVDRTDPPVLTFHGTEDKFVPFNQAKKLHKALDLAQVPNRLYAMEGNGHELDENESGFNVLTDYLNAYLRPTEMPLVAHDDFASGVKRWKPTDVSAWKLQSEAGRTWYSLVKDKSDYQPKVRSPWNISLLEGVEVGDFVLDVDLRSTHEPYAHQSLCLFFGHQDPEHFYYVHFGRKADAHANSIFLVNGAPRVSIAKERTDGTDWSRGWHRARIVREAKSGKIDVYFDDMQKPVMSTVDKTFTTGKVGVGSFDDTGDFDSFRLWGRATR